MKIGIEEYLKVTCQLIIDEFNEKYKYIDNKEQLKAITCETYSLQDISTKIGDVFKCEKFYRNGNIHIGHNDYIISLDFLKNYKTEYGTRSGSSNWSEQVEYFNWLEDEIRLGNKGKRIVVLGWFNYIDRLSQVIQLGYGRGSKPPIDDSKFIYFPFLKKTSIPAKTEDIDFNYSKAYKKLSIDLIGSKEDIEYNCMFIGSKEDKFHFAIYF
nr:hypothetical protein [uncultured Romboutsia sp.]